MMPRLLGCLLLLAAAALGGCRRPNLPAALAPVTLATTQGRSFELTREVPGVGHVTERVLSREPSMVRGGQCAGQMELLVPGAPGGEQHYVSNVGCPGGVTQVRATRRDPHTGQTWLYEPTLDQMMRARALVLQDRSDGGRWFLRDVLHDARSWTGVAHALGHTHPDFSDADRVPRTARQLVVLLSMNSGFPHAGAQWDDVQVALLDQDGNPLARLTLDPVEVGTHAALQVRQAADGKPLELAYVGLLRDATGSWRFVDLSVVVNAQEAQKVGGLGAAWNTAVSTHRTHVLTQGPEGALGHLWVDGVEWMAVDQVGGVLDEVIHQPTSLVGGDLTLNPAPEEGPLWLLGHAASGGARIAYDVGVFGDTWGLLPRIPAAARRGWAHVHDQLAVDGKRTSREDELELDRPYSSRTFRFAMPTGQRVKITNQLVAVRHADGTLEYGLRQVAGMDN